MTCTRALHLLSGIVLWTVVCSPSLAAPPLQGERVHLVQPGDTLGHIAARHTVSVTDLVAVNGLDDPDHITVGQRLRIPVPEGVR